MNMQIKKLFTALSLLCALVIHATAQQLSINSALISPENLSGSMVSNISVTNFSVEFTAQFKIVIQNTSRSVIAETITFPVKIKKGTSLFNSSLLKVQSQQISSDKIGNYLKSFRKLPTGSYVYCINIIGSNEVGGVAEFCDEFVVENEFGLFLVNPLDGDVLDNLHPTLIWMHTEPFGEVTPNLYYKIVVTEKHIGQTNESAITSNPIIFSQSNLLTHSVKYPLGAPELKAGKIYTWQVQKISNGKVINQTEAWNFSVPISITPSDVKYAVLNKSANQSTYRVSSGKFYFKFDEEYNSNGSIGIKLFDSDHQQVPVNVSDDRNKNAPNNFKQTGYNSYLLDIENLHLKSETYLLEVTNGMGETFNLSFIIE